MSNEKLVTVGIILTIAAAYLNTRGKDGQFFGSIISFTILGIAYWTILWKSEKLKSRTAFLHLLAFEGGAFLGMLIDPGGGNALHVYSCRSPRHRRIRGSDTTNPSMKTRGLTTPSTDSITTPAIPGIILHV